MQAALETNSVCLPMTMKKGRGFFLSRNPLREGKKLKVGLQLSSTTLAILSRTALLSLRQGGGRPRPWEY